MFKSRFALIVVGVFLSLTLSGCYLDKQVQSNEVAIKLGDGVAVSDFVSAGRYTDMGLTSDIKVISVDRKSVSWKDPDLVTQDKQPIGLELAVDYARKRDKTSVLKMWNEYRGIALDDKQLEEAVKSRIFMAAKSTTTSYTLDQMLGIVDTQAKNPNDVNPGRERLAEQISLQLKTQLDEIGIEVFDVRIQNIAPDESYMKLLKEKANALISVEVAKANTKKLDEQLIQEQKQTAIEVEKAARQNKVNAQLAEVFQKSPQYYELERLKLLKDVIGPAAKIYFVPQGANISVYLSGSGEPVPVLPAPSTAK